MIPSALRMISSSRSCASTFSILATVRAGDPSSSSLARSSSTSAPDRTKDSATKSASCSTARARSARSFSVKVGREGWAWVTLIPLRAARVPRESTRATTSPSRTRSASMRGTPSPITICERSVTRSANPGKSTLTRPRWRGSSAPANTTVSPTSTVLSVVAAESRSFGPWRSKSSAIARPARWAAFRTSGARPNFDRLGARRAPETPAPLDQHERRRPDDQQGEALELGGGQPSDHVVVAPHELHEEALDPGEYEVEGEQHAGAEAVTPAPEKPGDEAHRQRLVDRRGLHGDAGRRRVGAVRIAHGPREVGGLAVVPVARDLAADAPDRVAERERRSGDVDERELQEPSPARPDQHRDRAAGETAVPDQPRPPEYVPDQAAVELAVILDQVVGARPDQAADHGGQHHLERPVGGLAELRQPPRRQGAPGHEVEGEEDAERLDRDTEDVDVGEHGGLGPRAAALRRRRRGGGLAARRNGAPPRGGEGAGE